MHYTKDMVFVSGQAKPTKEDAIAAIYQTFFLGLIVDSRTDMIIDASCTAALGETTEFVRSLLTGVNLATEVEAASEQIHRRFLALAQKTLIAALKDAQNRYLMAFPDKRKS